MLQISFPRSYSGVEVRYQDGELVIEVPFQSKTSAGIASGEMSVTVRPRVRVIDGEVLKGEQRDDDDLAV